MDDFYLSKFQKQRGRNQTYPEQIIAYTSFRTQSLSRYVRNDTRLVRKNYLPMQKRLKMFVSISLSDICPTIVPR